MSTQKTINSLIISLLVAGATACTEQMSAPTGAKSSTSVGARINGINAVPSNPGYIVRDSGGNRVSNLANSPIRISAINLNPNHVRGGRIYDDFMIELGDASMPTGPNPLAEIGTPTGKATPPTGMAEWLCSACHGFDYEGGVYTYNGGSTNNLLELRDVRGRDEEFVQEMLLNGFDIWDGTAIVNVHNYSAILTEQAIVDVADFVVNEIYDTHAVLRAPTGQALGDHIAGEEIFASPIVDGGVSPLITIDGLGFNCIKCHGDDAKSGTVGINLVTTAWEEPSMFLHRTLFGHPRDQATHGIGFVNDPTVMPGLYEVVLTEGLHFGSPAEGSEVMSHIQMMTP